MTDKPTKREVFDALLSNGDKTLFVMFDPRAAGVSVPAHLKGKTHVSLEVGLQMIVPIKDLLSHAGGFSGVFSFNRTPCYVHVPWAAVFWIGRDLGLDSCVGVEWPADVPRDALHKSDEVTEVRKRPALPKGWAVIDGGRAVSGPNTRGAA